MAGVLHGCARTTPRVRAEIQASPRALAAQHGPNPKTVARRRRRDAVEDAPMGPKVGRGTALGEAEEASVAEALAQRRASARRPLGPPARRRGRAARRRGQGPALPRGGPRLRAPPRRAARRGEEEATARSLPYETRAGLEARLGAYVVARDLGERPKGPRWRTPFQAVCDDCKKDPTRFKADPHHPIPEPNNCHGPNLGGRSR